MADGYVRLTTPTPVYAGQLDPAGAVLFVDVPPGAALRRLRDIPPTRVHAVRQLVVRAPGHTFEEVVDAADRLQLRARVARITHPLGGEPRLEAEDPWLTGPELIERCRAVELHALLELGDAVWRPTSYHYLLPSGQHASGFIRIADAIRSPHDASVLADWLARDVADGCALVADTETLTPLLLALQLRMVSEGLSPAQLFILDHYPRTQADTDAVIRAAGSRCGHLLVVLSVNSSGSLRDRVVRSLQLNEGQFESWALHVLVSNMPVTEGVTGEHWVPRPGHEPLVGAPRAADCDACNDSERSTLVPIDPRTFDGRLPDAVVKRTLSLEDPRANRGFFQLCDQAKAIGVEESSNPAVLANRGGSDRLAVKVRFELLLGHGGFAEAVRAKLEEKGIEPDADLVLIPEHEQALPGFDGLWEAIAPAIMVRGGQLAGFPVSEAWPDELAEMVEAARSITVFALGTISGRSLQRALVSVQDARNPSGLHLRGVVVHARPPDQRDWETLMNSYGHRLTALWLTRIPSWSPLVAEADALGALPSEQLPDAVRELVDRRRRLAEGGYGIEEVALFLGSSAEARLTPHSVYGDGLSAATTFMAVASAIEARRVEEDLRPPQRLVFDVRAITRSYYDPLILASVLRWLKPAELWWGVDPEEAGATVSEILERATPEQSGMLVSELLLAGALGKVPSPGLNAAVAKAEAVLPGADADVAAAVRLGIALIERS